MYPGPNWTSDRNWHELVDWWYGRLADEEARPPSVVDCPVGRLFLSLLAFAVDGPCDPQTLIGLLAGPWRTNLSALAIVRSGWPIFGIISRVGQLEAADGSPGQWCSYQDLMKFCIGRDGQSVVPAARLLLERTEGVGDRTDYLSAELALALAEASGDDAYTPGDLLLPTELRRILAALPSLADAASAFAKGYSVLALLLHVTQYSYVYQSHCSPGTRLVSARTPGGAQPFRLCVREGLVGLDAAAALHGEWDTCLFLREVHRRFVGPFPLDAPRRQQKCLIVDVGSHIGLCALAFAAHGCQIVAIDILAEHIDMVTRSAVVSGLRHNLRPVLAAASEASGGWVTVEGPQEGRIPQESRIGSVAVQGSLPIGGDLGASGVAVAKALGGSSEGEGWTSGAVEGAVSGVQLPPAAVERTTVDALLGKLNISLESVTLLKIDTEGHDLHVLRGAKRTISMPRPPLRSGSSFRPPVVVFELIDDGQDHGEVGFLTSHGFNVTQVNGALNYAVRR